MNYTMLGFGEPIDDCMARNGIYNSATDTCWCQYGTNVNDGKCITSTVLVVGVLAVAKYA
jgi:hypothetical protein